MINRLSAAKEFIQANWLSVLAASLIAFLAISQLVFFVSTLVPGLQARDKLVLQLEDARQKLLSAKGTQDESPASWQGRLTAARATLTTFTNAFVSEAQANQTLDALYQYARASGVTIIDLQNQPAPVPPTPTPIPTLAKPTMILATPSPTQLNVGSPQPSPTLTPPAATPTPPNRTPTLSPANAGAPSLDQYYVTRVRLRAQGTTQQLLDFAARIKESSEKGFVVNDISIQGNEGTATGTLTLVFSLYVSQFSTADTLASRQPASSPAPLPAATQMPASVTPVPPTASPTTIPPTATWTPIPTLAPRYVVYVVRPGDTLYSLARHFGVTFEAVMAANHLTDYTIRIGQQLLIPLP